MKIQIDRSRLFPTLNLLGNVVEKRRTLPILDNLFFKVENNQLLLVGTDLEMEISRTLKELQGDDGMFTASKRKIIDICRLLPEKSTISFNYDQDSVTMTSGRSRYTLKTLPAEDFPRIQHDDWGKKLTIKQELLRNLLNKTAFAMAVQDVRYYLNGILLQIDQQELKAIATDGHRLAQSSVAIELELESPQHVIIPRKAVTEISRLLHGDDDPDISLEVSQNHLKLIKDDTVLITKLIEGEFPKFKNVLDRKPKATVTVDRLAFIDMMNRAAVLTTNRFGGVKLCLQSDTMTVTATNLEQEQAVEEMEIEYAGEQVETGYNVFYLIEAARAASGETLQLNLEGGNDGICIMKQPDDPLSMWLVMPVRL